MEKFTYNCLGEPTPNCRFECHRYTDNNNLALLIYDDEGPVCTCSVNMCEPVDDSKICIKDWSENAGVPDELIRLGIIEPEPVDEIWNDFVSANVYNLTENGKQLFREQLKDYTL